MPDISCPACGEDDDLSGTPLDETIEITCGSCGRVWVRDLSPRCDRCGGDRMHGALRAIVERSRGTQLSIVSTEVVYLCADCDPEILARYRRGRSPLMPADLPTVNPEDT
jgi:predicted RNA-binding Zn-ribbon protein involved in translation (DUF1610 family)